jgi:hypothetical protein
MRRSDGRWGHDAPSTRPAGAAGRRPRGRRAPRRHPGADRRGHLLPSSGPPLAHVGNSSRLALALDWSQGPVPPGTARALGIQVTDIASTPTPDATLVVVHGFVPNTYTADPHVTL